MTMQAVYNNVLRPVVCDADGKLVVSGSVTATGGLTDTQLRASAVATTDSKGGTRQYDFTGNVRQAVTSTSTAAVALPTLYTSREVMVHSSERCFVRFGTSSVTAASNSNGQLILEAGERFHLRFAADITHFRVIRDTTDGNVTITAVVL